MWDKMTSEDIRMDCGSKYKLSERVSSSVMRLCGHMESMSEKAGEATLLGGGWNERGKP